MPESYNTPGVPTPEESAMQMRAKTAPLPSIQTDNGPLCYNQCVEVDGPVKAQVAQGNGPAYD